MRRNHHRLFVSNGELFCDSIGSSPPEQAYRYFEFPNGIPPEYYSFTDREDYRNEKGHTIEQTGPVAAWIATATEEQKLGTGHAVPGPSDE